MTGGYVLFPDFIIKEMLTVETGISKVVPGSYDAISKLVELDKPIVINPIPKFTLTSAYSGPIVKAASGEYSITFLFQSTTTIVAYFNIRIASNNSCVISTVFLT